MCRFRDEELLAFWKSLLRLPFSKTAGPLFVLQALSLCFLTPEGQRNLRAFTILSDKA